MARRRGSTTVCSMKVRSSGSASMSAVCGLGARTRSIRASPAPLLRDEAADFGELCFQVQRALLRSTGRGQRDPEAPRLRLLVNIVADGDVLGNEPGGAEDALVRPLPALLGAGHDLVDFAVELVADEESAAIHHLAECGIR